MIVNKRILTAQRGASMLEVLLTMAIVALATPLIYDQVTNMISSASDVARARRIMSVRDGVLNFVRTNQDAWPEFAQIRMDESDRSLVAPDAAVGFIDKYSIRGASVADVYLGFHIPGGDISGARIARHIGADAAIVGPDGVAATSGWAVSAPELTPGMLVYRMTRTITSADRSQYLHRTAMDGDELNTMMRHLNMGGNDIYDIGTVHAKSAKMSDITATFLETDMATVSRAYFTRGASVDGNAAAVGALRVTGDVTGFRTMTAGQLNSNYFGTIGRVITDRATVTNTVNVSGDMVLKSESARSISGFSGISTGAVMTPFLGADEMIFYDNFGLTVSGELMMSTTPPIKFGSWSFPSTSAPRFVNFALSRAPIPELPDQDEFDVIMSDGWRDAPSMDVLMPGGDHD